jgi:heme-degrading monooxygenase HmoA
MHVVIFEVIPHEDRAHRYFDLAAELRPELEKIDGFISVERFESLTNKGKFVSLSFWRDDEAVKRWHAQQNHLKAQQEGKQQVFKDFRIRVAEVIRDYSLKDRLQ